MTNFEFFNNFYDNYQKTNMSRSTYVARTSLLWHHLLDGYSGRELRSMRPRDIDDIYDAMEVAGLAQNSVFGMYAALSSFYGLAQQRGLIDENPVRGARTVHSAQR